MVENIVTFETTFLLLSEAAILFLCLHNNTVLVYYILIGCLFSYYFQSTNENIAWQFELLLLCKQKKNGHKFCESNWLQNKYLWSWPPLDIYSKSLWGKLMVILVNKILGVLLQSQKLAFSRRAFLSMKWFCSYL